MKFNQLLLYRRIFYFSYSLNGIIECCRTLAIITLLQFVKVQMITNQLMSYRHFVKLFVKNNTLWAFPCNFNTILQPQL